jgi:hypothetical protein
MSFISLLVNDPRYTMDVNSHDPTSLHSSQRPSPERTEVRLWTGSVRALKGRPQVTRVRL